MWEMISASVVGTSHLRLGLPCQDAHGCRVLENGAMAAVADGLGSAAKADEGARQAVDTALDTLERALHTHSPVNAQDWGGVLANAFFQARQRLEQTAEMIALPLREYGTTLLVAVVTVDGLAVGHLGDGAVVALLEDERLETISPPQRGEYANEVMPLTAPNALDLVRFSISHTPVKAIALLSDGLQNLCINAITGAPYAPFFSPFFEGISQVVDAAEASEQLAEFLASERIGLKTDDDKTLVVIGKIQSEATNPAIQNSN